MAVCYINKKTLLNFSDTVIDKSLDYLDGLNEFSDFESRDIAYNSFMRNTLIALGTKYPDGADIIRSHINEVFSSEEQKEILKDLRNSGVRDWFLYNCKQIGDTIKQLNAPHDKWDLDEVNTDILYEGGGFKFKPSDRFIYRAFGTAINPMRYARGRIDSLLTQACFFNRGMVDGQTGIVTTTHELNRNLETVQEMMFDDVKNYLRYIRNIDKTIPLTEEANRILDEDSGLYQVESDNQDSVPTNNLIVLKNAIEQAFKYFTPEALDKKYTDIKTSTQSPDTRAMAKMGLDAFSSYLFLNNFDSYLKILLGKTIDINQNYFGRRVQQCDKYQIANTSLENLPIWRTSENVNISDEVSSITKLLISSIPMIKWGKKLEYRNNGLNDFDETQYLNFQQFQHIIPKIRNIMDSSYGKKIIFDGNYYDRAFKNVEKQKIWNSLDAKTQQVLKDKSLNQIASETILNSKDTWHAIFQILSNNDFRELTESSDLYSKFDLYELDILNSIAEGIFSGDNSLYRHSDTGNKNYYDYISQTANSIYDVVFTQLYKDDDGVIQTRHLHDVTTDNIRASLEININNANSKYHNIFDNVIADFPKINNEEQILEIKNDKNRLTAIQFILPNTDIKINVNYTGNVTFSNNVSGKEYRNFSDIFRDIDPRYEKTTRNSITGFIDDMLALNLEDEPDLLSFLQEQYSNNEDTMYNGLLKFASRILGNMYVSNKYVKSLSAYENLHNKVVYPDSGKPRYNYQLDEMSLISDFDAVNNLSNIAVAEAKLIGLASSVFVKNAEGNNLSRQTFNRLLGSYQNLFSLKELADNSASKHFILLNQDNLLNGVVVSEEYADSHGESKKYSEMSVGELAHTQFKHAFVTALTTPDYQKVLGNGNALFYIGVMADRTIFPQLNVNINTKLKNRDPRLNDKSLRELNSQERAILTKQELGKFYLNVYNDVTNTLSRLDDYIKEYVENKYGEGVPVISLADDYTYNYKNFNDWCDKFIGKKPIDFVREMCVSYNYPNKQAIIDELNDNAMFVAASESGQEGFVYDKDNVEKANRKIKQLEAQLKSPIKLTDQIHFKEGKDGKLEINTSFLAQLVRYNPDQNLTNKILQRADLLDNYKTYEQFHEDQKFGMLKSMIDSKFTVNLNDKSAESQVIAQELDRYNKGGYGNYIANSGKIILAYLDAATAEGQPVIQNIPIASETDLILNNIDLDNKVANGQNVNFIVRLNPLIEQWNDLDFLLTQEFNCATGGSFIAHPDKSKSHVTLAQESNQNIANTKRNNTFVSQVDQYDLDTLDGLPSKIKIAAVDELYTKCPTINGQENDTDVSNAATWVHPAFVYLQKNSLSRGEKGIVTKPLIVFKDSNTGNGGEVKTAAFGITNDKMRNQPLLKNMFFKMGCNEWTNRRGENIDLDITKNSFTGKPIQRVSKYFRRVKEVDDGNGGTRKEVGYYMINDIVKDKNYRNAYIRTVTEVDKFGRILEDAHERVEDPVEINTNWDLWNLFGGEWSMEYDEDLKRLTGSENSILDLVTTMNSVSDQSYVKYDGIKSQKYIYQPLKQADIGWTATKESLKHGGGNINHSRKIRDINNNENLDWFYVDMINAGVQLDKEHSSDNQDIALMTQVINACSARGYTFDDANEMYRALNTITQISLNKFIKPLSEYFETGSKLQLDQFRETITDQIIKNLTENKANDISKNLTLSLIEEARGTNNKINFTKLALPLSDNQIYNKVISTISVFLTDLGIKMRIPGSLCVLNPTDSFFKLYDGRKYESFIDPESELEQIQQDYMKNKAIFDRDNTDKNDPNFASYVRIGRKYLITREGDEYENYNKPTLIETPTDIANIQEDCRDGNIVKIVEYIKDGRDLDSYNVWFNEIAQEGKTARKFQMWNLDCMKHLFDIDYLRKDAKNEIGEGNHPLWNMLQDIYRAEVGEEFNVDVSQFVKPEDELDAFNNALKQTEKLIRRRQQHELMVLTPDSPDHNAQYKVIEKEVDNAYKTGDKEEIKNALKKYAQWVNIYFGTGNGNKLYLTSVEENRHLTHIRDGNIEINLSGGDWDQIIDNETWDRLKTHVSNAIVRSTQVLIDGQYVSVDKNSIEIQPYENISSKLNTTTFGLEKDVDLNSVKNDENYFIKQQLRNYISKLSKEQYNIELKSSNGDHKYILLKSCLSNKQKLHKLNNIFYEYDEQGHKIRVTQHGRKMYELRPNVDIYADDKGNEVIVIDDTIIQREDNNYDQILKFYLDNLPYSSINISDKDFTDNKIEYNKVLDALLHSDNKKAQKLADSIVYNTKNGNVELQQAFKKVRDNYQGRFNIDVDNEQKFNDWLEKNANSNIVISGREKHTSFLRSLDNIESRTPAQCMQSFMPCRTVAFDNPDSNNAYISSYQILIQGSDFDIDTVNVTTFDFNNDGVLQMWSPYANITTRRMLDASETLPFPTGNTVLEESNIEDIPQIIDFLSRNIDCFSVKLKDNEDGTLGVDVKPIVETAENIVNFGKMLREAKDLKLLTMDSDKRIQVEKELKKHKNIEVGTDYIEQLINGISDIVNRHNLYKETLSYNNQINMSNNFLIKSVYKISMSPSNLIQSTESVDGSTEPLKEVINRLHSGKNEGYFGPGNVVAKFQNMNNVLVGKNGVGIYAVSMKVIDGLTQYYNSLLNSGDAEKQQKVLLGKEGKGIKINGKTYYTLANIRAMDINSIKNPKVLEALSKVTQDTDAFITNSAMMSLAVDNAKEMKLYQMNANQKTMGLYSYGTAIGVPFEELARILMSPTGKIITQLTEGNLFNNDNGFNSVLKAVSYLNGNYWSEFSKFRSKSAETLKNSLTVKKKDGTYLNSDFVDFVKKNNGKAEKAKDKIDFGNDKSSFTAELYKFIKSPLLSLREKLNILETSRKYSQSIRDDKNKEREAQLIADYNNMIDYLEEYTTQVSIVKTNPRILEDIEQLAMGADEFFDIGQMFGYNQGIKTDQAGLLRQINYIEESIYKRKGTKDQNDIIDIGRFAFDKEYQQQKIKEYEDVKHTTNILDAIVNVPHFAGYLQALAIDVKGKENTFKFRSIRKMLSKIKEATKNWDMNKLYRGIENYLNDYIRNEWLSNQKKIWIPKGDIKDPNGEGNWTFSESGVQSVLKSDTEIRLGSDDTNAMFRAWMERDVIPNLKKGNDHGKSFSARKKNKFIKGLSYSNLSNRSSGNRSSVISLKINMSPRSDHQEAILASYRGEFNKLTTTGYNYVYDIKYRQGNQVATETRSESLLDLFTYYTMIAHNWERRDNSLIRIFDEFQNTGLIKSYHDFESDLDKSDMTFTIGNEIPEDIIPYVARTGSPYRDNGQWMWYREKKNASRILLKFKGKPKKSNGGEEEDYAYNDYGIEDDVASFAPKNDYGLYNKYSSEKHNQQYTNYFPLNRSLVRRTIAFEIPLREINGQQVQINMRYQPKTRTFTNLSAKLPNGKEIKIKLENNKNIVPIKKLNTGLDTSLVIDTNEIRKAILAELGYCE